MNTQDSDRILTEVPHTSTLCLRHPLDGPLATERCTLQMFPNDGHMYLAGVFTFAVDDEADLRLTIRHPRTHRPFVVDGAAMFDVQAVSLNPDVRSKKYSQFRYREFFVPISGTRNEDGNREPAYCSKEQPLLIDVEGDTVLHLVVLGADHYTVTRLPYPFSHPESLGEFRGPYCDPASLIHCTDAVEERLSELDLVRAVRDLCADEVSGCLYRDEDAPDAGDDVRSLDPADLLARIRARR